MAPAYKRCHVFDVAGGAVPWKDPNADWLDESYAGNPRYGQFLFTATTCIPYLGSATSVNCHSDGIDNNQLIVFLSYIRPEVCDAITTLTRAPIGVDGNAIYQNVPFVGSYADTNVRFEGQGNGTRLSGCAKITTGPLPATGSLSFWSVLLVK